MTRLLNKPLWRHIAAIAGMASTLAGGFWIIKPHAEQFIRETTQNEIQALKDKTASIETNVEAIRREQAAAKRDRRHLESLLLESRSDIKTILFHFKRP